MTVFNSPFASSSVAIPGKGTAVLSILPPSLPALTTLTYKYPLKLLSRTPTFTPKASVAGVAATRPVHLYLLTYGGGLLPGDDINVAITLDDRTRMVLTTPQGSTKIFKTAPRHYNRNTVSSSHTDAIFQNARNGQSPSLEAGMLEMGSRQTLDVRIGREAGLCYLPDPSCPFKDSRYEQVQVFTIHSNCSQRRSVSEYDPSQRSSICVLDWVTQGRTSRGENWDFHVWKGKNEVWTEDTVTGKRTLLLRDSVILDDENEQEGGGNSDGASDNTTSFKRLIREHTSGQGIIGTLILYGPLFDSLGSYFMHTFTSQSRIGGQNWSSSTSASVDQIEGQSNGFDTNRSGVTPSKDVTWTAARVRAGFVLVKFGAKHFETARDWLGGMIRAEGSVVREFGEEALFCL